MPFARGDIITINAVVPHQMRPSMRAKVVRVFRPSLDPGPFGGPPERIYMVAFDDGRVMQMPESCFEKEPAGHEASEPMKLIDLDAGTCRSIIDFLNLLRGAIGSPEWQGMSVDAFIDTMLFGGAELQPPYTIRVRGISTLPAELAADIKDFINAIDDYIERQCGPDRDERLEVAS